MKMGKAGRGEITKCNEFKTVTEIVVIDPYNHYKCKKFKWTNENTEIGRGDKNQDQCYSVTISALPSCSL